MARGLARGGAKERDGRLLRRRHSRASLCFNVQRRSLLPLHESGGSARETPATRRPRSRDRKVEIFISNGACKVSGAPPLQVIFMGPPRSNELIFTFYAFIPRASTVRPPRNRETRIHSIRPRFRQKNCPPPPTTIIKIAPPLGHILIFSAATIDTRNERFFGMETNLNEDVRM